MHTLRRQHTRTPVAGPRVQVVRGGDLVLLPRWTKRYIVRYINILQLMQPHTHSSL